jgi:hypothetical protein
MVWRGACLRGLTQGTRLWMVSQFGTGGSLGCRKSTYENSQTIPSPPKCSESDPSLTYRKRTVTFLMLHSKMGMYSSFSQKNARHQAGTGHWPCPWPLLPVSREVGGEPMIVAAF